MLIKRISVKTSAPCLCELSAEFISQITQEFGFTVTPFTKIRKLLKKAGKVCKSNDTVIEIDSRFLLQTDSQTYQLDGDGSLWKLLAYIGNPTTVNLEYVVGIPGGLGVETKNGIYYFYHIKERRHVPHIHAKYQGEEITIKILTLQVLGHFKNKKKQKEAIEYVKSNQMNLLEEYNQKTNGIHIDSKYIENGKNLIG